MTDDERKKLVELYSSELTNNERARLMAVEEAGHGLGKPQTREELRSLGELFGNPDCYFDGTPSYFRTLSREERAQAIAYAEERWDRLEGKTHKTEVA